MAFDTASPAKATPMRQRPIYGGVFGGGRYSLASMPFVSHGLHAVRYMVIEHHAGGVLSIAEDKREALAAARRLLAANDEGLAEQQWQQTSLWGNDELLPAAAPETPVRSISRRRREIFERSEGRCHYCRTALTLDGKWHIEHMVPRALDGSDDAWNLVAACVACNLSKRDRTALEFVMQGGEHVYEPAP